MKYELSVGCHVDHNKISFFCLYFHIMPGSEKLTKSLKAFQSNTRNLWYLS